MASVIRAVQTASLMLVLAIAFFTLLEVLTDSLVPGKSVPVRSIDSKVFPKNSTPPRSTAIQDLKSDLLATSTGYMSKTTGRAGVVASTVSSAAGNCHSFPDTSDMLVVMKTGATEAYKKLPIHLMTTLKCTHESILISDMKMNMAGHHLIDVLQNYPQALRDKNPDFDMYRNWEQLNELSPNQLGSKANNAKSSWTLDKYKFIPMLRKAWEHQQMADWYVFIEADTAVLWSNLRSYLDRRNSSEPLYIGSPTKLDIVFAHGGTGYVISNAAMKQAVGNHPEIEERYNKDVKSICCGDRMVARIMLDQGIDLTRAWPKFNGEKPITLPFGKEQWCQPVITMHHMTSQEISQVWNFEQNWRKGEPKDPITWKDIFNHFIRPSLLPERDDWDNLSNDAVYISKPNHDSVAEMSGQPLTVEELAGRSTSECKAVCAADAKCFQWHYSKNTCRLGHTIKFGYPQSASPDKTPDKQDGSKSGWMFDRIGAFRQEMEECRKGIDWGEE